MNNSKVLSFGCAVAISMASFSAEAASRQEGLDACAGALVVEMGSENDAPLSYKVGPESDLSSKRMARREVFHLDARDPASEEVIARADCVVDGRANVLRLVSVPLSADDAAIRAMSL